MEILATEYNTSYLIFHNAQDTRAHVYNKGYIIKIVSNVILHATPKASTQATSVLTGKVWITSWLGRTRCTFLPSRLRYIVPVQTDSPRKPQLAS
jgi:hypothetical protein